jgi:hypothetical protein
MTWAVMCTQRCLVLMEGWVDSMYGLLLIASTSECERRSLYMLTKENRAVQPRGGSAQVCGGAGQAVALSYGT